MPRIVDDLGGLSWGEYTEAEIIFALKDESIFLETYGKMNNVSKDTVRKNPDTLISTYYEAGRKRITPDQAKEILAKHDYLEVLREYGLA